MVVISVPVDAMVWNIDSNRLFQTEAKQRLHRNIQFSATRGKSGCSSGARSGDSPDGGPFTTPGDRAKDCAKNGATTGEIRQLFS